MNVHHWETKFYGTKSKGYEMWTVRDEQKI